MIDEIKKPPAPAPPSASIRTSTEITTDKSPNKIEKTTLTSEKQSEIANLEKLLEVQDAKFNAAIQDLTAKLYLETEKRTALQAELQKLAQCVTQV
ncbi:hypothetical protein MSG28_002770 [Choristoneura fumiferana]|uniref:Uncharacterized protein n=1 Tax=Choristoneura fumiferana TaxID=7141 RepID=A0ACC0JJA3_CHOFU|nr:hypothetical protein MSG28_002770 [Choristoneura fumiferana]